LDMRTAAFVNAINKLHEYYSVTGISNWFGSFVFCYLTHLWLIFIRKIEINLSGSKQGKSSLKSKVERKLRWYVWYIQADLTFWLAILRNYLQDLVRVRYELRNQRFNLIIFYLSCHHSRLWNVMLIQSKRSEAVL
jgi:hypothetical protein